jgi:hypothetical protein
LALCTSVFSVQPYYSYGEINSSLNDASNVVCELLQKNEFYVVGAYNPSGKNDLKVIVFTCDELTSLATGVANYGAFASTLKVGLIAVDDNTIITLSNPKYLLNAYLDNEINREEILVILKRINRKIKKAFSPISKTPSVFGYDVSTEVLRRYNYLPTMAQFTDLIELESYIDFSGAVSSLKYSLSTSSEYESIYELIFNDKEIAVFGVSLANDGIEDEILDLIGFMQVSSLPLQIIIQGNKAYMLNGKYRIPLFKPDIPRTDFTKILRLAFEMKRSMKNITSFRYAEK